MKFIDELKKEHKKLFQLLDGFKKGQGITGSDWKDRLFSTKQLFTAHLEKEDKKLYPVLLKAAGDDEFLKKTVSGFIEDMKKVSAFTLKFLEKYKAVSGGTDFIKDFAELEILLKNRMTQEESVLFKEYEKVSGR